MKIRMATLTAVTPGGYPVTIPVELDEGERITDAINKIAALLSKNGWEPPQAVATAVPDVEHGSSSFAAEQMVATVDKGVAYWKVVGGPYQKFGVSIWPEALLTSGFNPDEMNPLKPIDLRGWTAYFLTKEGGKPKKVTRLEPPQ